LRVRLSLFFFLLPILLHAQGVDIRGVVADSLSGERLPFANVVLVGTNRGAATNLQGFFLITNVAPGTYTISVSSIGYASKRQSLSLQPGQPIVISFELTPTVVEFSEIVITEHGKRELTEISTSIHLLDQKDIRLVPTTLQEDIFRSIRILPGVVSTSDVNSQFYVRGGGGDQNLILLDGIKVYNPYHAFGIFSIFDPDIIKTTEVYTGAFPPGFGGRLSSVVNMTTRDGGRKEISGKANLNFLSTKLQAEGPMIGDASWLISGRRSLFSNAFKNFLHKDLPLSFYDVFAKVTVQGSEHSKYGLQLFLSGDDLRSPQANEPDYSWRNEAFGFLAAGLIQDRVFINAVGYENKFTARRIQKDTQAQSAASTQVREVGVRANATLYTDSRDLYFFGFEFSFPTLEYNLVNNFGIPRRLYSSFVETSTWLRYQATLGSFQIDGGFHIDLSSILDREGGIEVLQPRVNISQLLFDNWRIKGSIGRFSQNIITVNNEDDVISLFDAWIRVPLGLDSEQADHFVVGIDGNIVPALSTSVQTYYKHYRRLVSYNRDKVDALDPDYVNSRGRAYGIETLIRYGSPILDLYVAYTLGWTSITVGDFTYYPRYDRRHNLNALGVLHLLDRVDVTVRWEVGSGFPFTQSVGYYDRLHLKNIFNGSYVGETGRPYSLLGEKNAVRLPAYHRMDLSATYRFAIEPISGTLGVHVINVYDHRNIFYFDRKTGQKVYMLPFFPSVTLNLEY
jgi:hypothetical protein